MDLKHIVVAEKIIENKKYEMLWIMNILRQHENMSESLKATWIKKAKRIKEKSDDLERERKKVIEQVQQVKNPKHSQVLMMKYVDRLMNHEIAEILCISTPKVKNLLTVALKEYERMYQDVK